MHFGCIHRFFLAVLWLCVAGPVFAQRTDSSQVYRLEQSVITEHRDRQLLSEGVGISGEINLGKIQAVPSFLGNGDPLRFVRLLPSVQLNAENEGGLYMQGSEHSHTLISQGGVPLYGVSHLLGMYSIFNSSHYKGMRYGTSPGPESRIGGGIDLQLQDSLVYCPKGEFSVGLLSAQGTVAMPAGRKSSVFLSARRTYMNLLYSPFMRNQYFSVSYGFTDANLTWLWKPSKKDKVWVDAFYAQDAASISGFVFDQLNAKWQNYLGALHWVHYFPQATLRQSAYVTAFSLKPRTEVVDVTATMDSHILDAGYKATLEWGGWRFDTHHSFYYVQPQNPKAEGYFNESITGNEPVQRAWESLVSADYSLPIGSRLTLSGGLGANWYLGTEKQSWWGVSPHASIQIDMEQYGDLSLRYALKRQNLFQLGYTSTGLPCEFWALAGDLCPPQRSHGFSIAYNVERPVLAFSAEAYYKKLYNQLEFFGSIMDLMTSVYDLSSSVQQGDGRAFGFNAMLHKRTGKLTGWVSYAFSRSLRTFDNPYYQGEYPSNHERIHELDLVATYDFGRWNLGGTLMAASGTPYTRPESFSVLGDRVFCYYGEHNGARLPAYFRVDLSLNWFFHKDARRKSGLNFSLYNVLMRNNAVTYGLMRDYDSDTFTFRPLYFNIKLLPSVAYFYSF